MKGPMLHLQPIYNQSLVEFSKACGRCDKVLNLFQRQQTTTAVERQSLCVFPTKVAGVKLENKNSNISTCTTHILHAPDTFVS